MHPYETGLHGPTGERKSSNTTKILKKAETSHRCAHALTYIKSTQSMHQFETGLHQLEKTNSSNTTKILKKAETSPYETDMKSHQTCTGMKQMCSCLTYIKTPQSI